MGMRILVPELLDSLPPSDAGAVASRRDLRRINGVMGNFRWFRKRMAAVPDAGTVLEIGAGDGTLGGMLFRDVPGLAARYCAIDLAPRPPRWPGEAAWHQMDLWSAAAEELLAGASVVLTNMVLHHFEDADLRKLGARLGNCRLLLACEPCRRERHVWQGRLLFPILHRVTRHDMVVSIRAGFRGDELAGALGFLPPRWKREVAETFLGAHRLAVSGVDEER